MGLASRAAKRMYPRNPRKSAGGGGSIASVYARWMGHRGGELQDTCPCCGALVIVRPRAGESDVSHAVPACAPFMAFMSAAGGTDLRYTARRVG